MMEAAAKNDKSAIYAVWLSMLSDIGNVRAKLLLDYFGSAEKVYNCGRNELTDIQGLRPQMVNELTDKDLSKAEKIISKCEQTGIKILSVSDKDYPDRLRNIYNPPSVLYIRGRLPRIDDLAVVGIVGTRRCTPYGIKNAENAGRSLSQHGIAVATGLAIGIDTAAAIGALTGQMPVIGVIGCGVDTVYPLENKTLFDKVARAGAIVSEYPPGTEARAEFFPARNRIISGLSLGVAIIEAPQKSGALITAQYALEQGRDVFVLPGNVDDKACMGSNKLLRLGAIPFISAEDIIDEYRDLYPGIKKPIDNNEAVDYIDVDKALNKLGGNEKAIAESIVRSPLYIDEIIASTGISAPVALAALTSLELDGYIRRDSMNKFALSKDLSGKWEIAK